jgi:hypothetical protein
VAAEFRGALRPQEQQSVRAAAASAKGADGKKCLMSVKLLTSDSFDAYYFIGQTSQTSQTSLD